jgi:acetyl esterase
VALAPACGILQVSDPLRFSRRKAHLPTVTQDVISSCFYSYIGDHARLQLDAGLADPLLVFEDAAPPDRPIPPMFLLCGTKDPLLDDTRRMAAALAARGVRHAVEYYPGQEHAFHAWVLRPQARRAWADQLRFLAPYTGALAPVL